MNPDNYAALKATMPWRHEITPTTKGGNIRLLDKDGNEVPLISLVVFMEYITGKIASR